MDTFELSHMFLWAALSLAALSCAGNLLATQQMARERYYWVPFVKLLRRCDLPAMAFAGAFAFISLCVSNPMAALGAISWALLIGMVANMRLMLNGCYRLVMRLGMVPALLVLLPLANMQGLEVRTIGSLHLPWFYPLVGVIAAASLHAVNHLHGIQDYLRRRD